MSPRPPPSPTEMLRRVLGDLRRRHGWTVGHNEARLRWHDGHWRLSLPSHVGVIAADPEQWARIEREHELAEAMRPALGGVLPRVTIHDVDLRVHLRERVFGRTGIDVESIVFGSTHSPSHELRYHPGCPLSPLGSRLAEELGRTLAQVHGALPVEEARGMGLAAHDVEITLEAVSWVLARRVSDPVLRRGFARVRQWWSERYSTRVVVHGTPGPCHLVVDPTTGALRALLDFDHARLASREHDLRALCRFGVPFARQALTAYRATASLDIEQSEVWRSHVCGTFEDLAMAPPESTRFGRLATRARAAVLGLAPRWA